MVSSTPRPHFTPGKDPVPILQEAGWAPGPVWTGGKSRPHRDSIPNRQARSSVAIPTELPGPHFIKFHILPKSITQRIIRTMNYVELVLLPTHICARPPCCYHHSSWKAFDWLKSLIRWSSADGLISLSHIFLEVGKGKAVLITGLEWPRGFQEVKVPRFHVNGTGCW